MFIHIHLLILPITCIGHPHFIYVNPQYQYSSMYLSMFIHVIYIHPCPSMMFFLPIRTHPHSSMFINISSMHSSKSIFHLDINIHPPFFHSHPHPSMINPCSITLIHLSPHPSTYLYTHSHDLSIFIHIHLHSSMSMSMSIHLGMQH